MNDKQVQTGFDDDAKGIRYIFVASRELTRAEIVSYVRSYNQGKHRKPKRGETVKIHLAAII
jgi:hypothetical protein